MISSDWKRGRAGFIYGGNIESTFLSCYVAKLSCASQILCVIARLLLVYTQTENSSWSLYKFWNTRCNFFNLSARVVSNLSIFLAVVCKSLLALWVLKTHKKGTHNKCKLLLPTMNVPAETLISQNGKSEPLLHILARETELKKGRELYIPCAKLAPSIRCLLIKLVQTVSSLKRNVVSILNCVLLELTAKNRCRWVHYQTTLVLIYFQYCT